MQSRSIFGISAILVFVLAIWWGHDIRRPVIKVDRQSETITFRSEIIKLVSVGFKRAIGDITWVQTLMESDLDHYKQKDLNSWLYLRFLSIIHLDPRFYEVYRYGGQYLMIVKDDLLGADDLMKRGLPLFPNDYHLNWQLGFLHAIEMGDVDGSYPYFTAIKDNPERPGFFETFYTKIVAQSFGPQEAFQVAYELWKQHKDGEPEKIRLADYLYSLQAQIDLKCLNEGHSNCRMLDFEQKPYFKNSSGKWESQYPVREVKLFKTKDQ